MGQTNRLILAIQRALYNLPVRDRRPERTPASVDESFRLSAFQMPKTIVCELAEPKKEVVVLRFEYPNDETPERQMRAVLQVKDLKVLLGKNSKKILEMRLPADYFAQSEHLVKILVSSAQSDWVRDLPTAAQRSAHRNAEVVAEIIDAIPAQSRREILEHLQTDEKQETGEFAYVPTAVGT